MDINQLLEKHDELYNKLLQELTKLNGKFPLDDNNYSAIYYEFVKIGKLLNKSS